MDGDVNPSENILDRNHLFHTQPLSLSTGYESLPVYNEKNDFFDMDYQQNDLKTKIKMQKSIWKRLEKYDDRRLCLAVSMNDTSMVNTLLDKGASPKYSDSHGRTPLHLAACKGYAHIVKILIDRGANPNARDLIGNTALHLAACTNNIDVVLLLLKAGGDAISVDKVGRSPLLLAQSKLKILQQSNFPDEEVKKQVSQVIEMLIHFSSKGQNSLDPELLSSFMSKVQLSDTREQVDVQLQDLLDNLGSLNIKS